MDGIVAGWTLRIAYFPSPLVGEGGQLPIHPLDTIGGLRPPFFNWTPMLCIGYAKSASDEGFILAFIGIIKNPVGRPSDFRPE